MCAYFIPFYMKITVTYVHACSLNSFLYMHLRFWLISYPPKYTKTKFKVYFNKKPSHCPIFLRFSIHIDRTSDLIDCKFANWILSMSLKDCSCHKIHLWNVWKKNSKKWFPEVNIEMYSKQTSLWLPNSHMSPLYPGLQSKQVPVSM